MSSHSILYKPVRVLWFRGGVTPHHSLHKLRSLTCDTRSKNQACVHKMDGDKLPPPTLAAAWVLRTHGWFFTEERKCSAVAWVSRWLQEGNKRPMASRYSAQLVWIQLRNPEGCVFLITFLLYAIGFDVTFLLHLWFRVFQFKTKWHTFISRSLLAFFLDFSKVYFHLFCQKKVYTACFSCAPSPQWLGTNTGSSQGSKGPSYDGNSFVFHNSTRRTCTHKRCRCGNGMVC